MRKFCCIAIAVLSLGAAAIAQPRAIGIRVTYGLEASYQHSFENNFLEGDLGWYGGGALNAHASYNFILNRPSITSEGVWNVYAGPAAGIHGYDGGFLISAGGQVGVEYTFKFPLQLSIDIRPDIISFGSQIRWFYNWYPSLGVRYRF